MVIAIVTIFVSVLISWLIWTFILQPYRRFKSNFPSSNQILKSQATNGAADSSNSQTQSDVERETTRKASTAKQRPTENSSDDEDAKSSSDPNDSSDSSERTEDGNCSTPERSPTHLPSTAKATHNGHSRNGENSDQTSTKIEQRQPRTTGAESPTTSDNDSPAASGSLPRLSSPTKCQQQSAEAEAATDSDDSFQIVNRPTEQELMGDGDDQLTGASLMTPVDPPAARASFLSRVTDTLRKRSSIESLRQSVVGTATQQEPVAAALANEAGDEAKAGKETETTTGQNKGDDSNTRAVTEGENEEAENEEVEEADGVKEEESSNDEELESGTIRKKEGDDGAEDKSKDEKEAEEREKEEEAKAQTKRKREWIMGKIVAAAKTERRTEKRKMKKKEKSKKPKIKEEEEEEEENGLESRIAEVNSGDEDDDKKDEEEENGLDKKDDKEENGLESKTVGTESDDDDKKEEDVSEDACDDEWEDDDESGDDDDGAESDVELDVSPDVAKADELKADGNAAFKNEDYSDAMKLYTKALLKCPKEGEDQLMSVLLCNRGACHLALKKYEAVVGDCTDAIEFDDKYVKAYLRRFRAHEALEKWHDALTDINKAMELDPSLKSTYYGVQKKIEKLSQEQFEKEKAELVDKLKTFGNWALGKVGLSLENFKLEQNPDTGAYNIQFIQQQAAAAAAGPTTSSSSS